MTMDNWDTLKTALKGDLDVWDSFVSQLSAALERERVVSKRNEIKGALAPLLVYQEVTKHYLEVMDNIEDGTYSLEEDDDGGNPEESD